MAKRAKKGPTPVPLSVARSRLFELAESVFSGRTRKVALSHKGRDEELVLMRASDVEKLEAEVAASRGRVASTPRPFSGTLKLHAPVEEILAEIRARQNALFEAKMRDIFGPVQHRSDVSTGGRVSRASADPPTPRPARRRRAS